MNDFATIKEGQKLLVKGRRLKSGLHSMTEWTEVEVEKVSKCFYFIEGEKYRKDSNGKCFTGQHYFPGQNGAPLVATESDAFDNFSEKVRVLNSTDLIRTGILEVRDLDKAVEFTNRINKILHEIEIAKSV